MTDHRVREVVCLKNVNPSIRKIYAVQLVQKVSSGNPDIFYIEIYSEKDSQYTKEFMSHELCKIEFDNIILQKRIEGYNVYVEEYKRKL